MAQEQLCCAINDFAQGYLFISQTYNYRAKESAGVPCCFFEPGYKKLVRMPSLLCKRGINVAVATYVTLEVHGEFFSSSSGRGVANTLYWYNCDSNYWSGVYKHTYGKDFKFKAGYDSEVRLGWASLWVGDEGGKAKTAPMKMKVQFMLQVPQDDIKSSVLMFRIKKRWDI